MGSAADVRLKSMAQSLQQHIKLANELNLGVAAQLLAMAVMEIAINMNGISDLEMDALCAHVEENALCNGKQVTADTRALPGSERRSRSRRG
jgi:hypothetical protein